MKREDQDFLEKICNWYVKHGRYTLPWRNTVKAYNILIAEIMLQKTHAVEQVLPVYKEFLKKYPNPEKLSEADVNEIRETICSLGLQNVRSRRFKKLGKKIEEQFNGKVPDTYDELVSLPGVGEYVANAVLCMAFSKKTVMVDANFGRVLGRMFYGKEEYPPSKNKIWRLAKELITDKQCKPFNLGIIDLGALICRPQSPKCKQCLFEMECIYSIQTKKAMTT